MRLLLPLGGLSMLDAPGQPFDDPQADAALFEVLEREFRQTPSHRLVRVAHHINEPAFAQAVVAQVRNVLG